MSDTKISEAAVEASAAVLYTRRFRGTARPWVAAHDAVRDIWRGDATEALAAAIPHLHPQPAALAEQQGVERITVRVGGVGQCTLTVTDGGIDIPASTIIALAATGKQQVGEVQGWPLYISDEDRAVLQRIQDALPTVGLNGWTKGVEVLERLLRDSLAARQPGAQRPVAGPYLDEPDAPSNPLWKRLRSIANWLTVLAPDCHMEAAELLLTASARIQRNDAAPPAQGIDLGPLVVSETADETDAEWLCRKARAEGWNAYRDALIGQRDAVAQPVMWSVLKIGNEGAFYDPKGARRAFTYAHQPGNIIASNLGRAANEASRGDTGDNIDRGLSLLKSLQDQGFGVFQIGECVAPPKHGVDLGQVREIRIPARNNLDPISVFIQDQAPGRGRIVVTCYGNAWQAFWGGMGDRTVMEFVAQCDADYVAGNMISGRQTRMTKAERAYTERIATEVIAEFRALRDDQRDAAPGVGT